jgi:hypothetical protein
VVYITIVKALSKEVRGWGRALSSIEHRVFRTPGLGRMGRAQCIEWLIDDDG